MNKNFKKLILPLSIFAAMQTHALGLGGLQVNSALDETLDGKIPLVLDGNEEVENLTVSLASNSEYQKVGLDKSYVPANIKVDLIENAGQQYIEISSRGPVSEPIVSLLLVVDWSNGRLLREYTLLLDPPIFNNQQNYSEPVQTQTYNAPQQITSNNQVDNVQSTISGTSTRNPAPNQVVVESGDTLWEIAQLYSSGSTSSQQMMVAIFDNNPSAFQNNDMNMIKKGAILDMPSADQLSLISNNEAISQVRSQTQRWSTLQAATDKRSSNTSSQRDYGIELVPPNDSDSSNDNGFGSNNNAASSARASQLQEDLISSNLENQELSNRIKELELIVSDQKAALSLKDTNLAQLQNQLGNSKVADDVWGDTETMISDTMSDDKMVDDTMISDTMSDDKMVDDTMISETMSDDKMVDDTMISDTMSDDKMVDDTMISDTMSDDKMVDDTMISETMSDDKMVDDTMISDTMSDDKMVDDTMISETMSDDAMASDTMVDENMVDDQSSVVDSDQNTNDVIQTPTRPPQRSFFDKVMDYKNEVLIGFGALLLAIIGFVFYKRRDQIDEDEGGFLDSISNNKKDESNETKQHEPLNDVLLNDDASELDLSNFEDNDSVNDDSKESLEDINTEFDGVDVEISELDQPEVVVMDEKQDDFDMNLDDLDLDDNNDEQAPLELGEDFNLDDSIEDLDEKVSTINDDANDDMFDLDLEELVTNDEEIEDVAENILEGVDSLEETTEELIESDDDFSLDFDLDELEGFDLDDDSDKESAEDILEDDFGLDLDISSGDNELEDIIEDDGALDDLVFDTDDLATTQQQESHEDLDLSLDLSGELDLGLDDNEGLNVEGEELLDDIDIGLDFDDLVSDDAIDTKLDLAKAYYEMGDLDGANQMVVEIIDEGNDEQKAKAESLKNDIENS